MTTTNDHLIKVDFETFSSAYEFSFIGKESTDIKDGEFTAKRRNMRL